MAAAAAPPAGLLQRLAEHAATRRAVAPSAPPPEPPAHAPSWDFGGGRNPNPIPNPKFTLPSAQPGRPRAAGSLRSHQLAGTLRGDGGTAPAARCAGRRDPAAGTLRGTQREGASVLGTLREARSPGEGASPAETLQGGGAGVQQGAVEEGLAGAGVEEGASGDVGIGTLRGTAGGPGRPGDLLAAPAGGRSGAPIVVRSSCARVTMCCLPSPASHRVRSDFNGA